MILHRPRLLLVFRVLGSMSGLAVLAACGMLSSEQRPQPRTTTALENTAPAGSLLQQPVVSVVPQQQEQRGNQIARLVDAGSDKFTGSPAPQETLLDRRRDGSETFRINLVGASVAEAARAVLGDALNLNYQIKDGVEGRISLEASQPLARSALLDAFQASLEFNGATLLQTGNIVTIAPLTEAPASIVSPGDRRGFGRRIVVIPLRFIGTAEMVRILQPIVSEDAILNANPKRNVLMVSGTQAQIDAIIDAVNVFDVDVLRGKSVALFKLNAADPASVSAELTRVFEAQVGGNLEGVVSFVPNERLGSVLMITSRRQYVARAEQWVRRLDASADRLKRQSVVYPLQNRSAVELAPVLTEIIGAWSNTVEVVAEDENGDVLVEGGKTVVVADDAANAIVAWATAPEQEEIAGIIRQLDATPAQVLLEATIAEVSLNDELNLGLRWFFESGNFSLRFSDLASGAVTSTFPGFSFLFDGGSALIALNALSSITDVNVVSTPSLLVIDNREAELRVGDQVPVATQSAVDVTDPTAPIVNSISLRDTGVILKIRPRVSAEGRIIMDIEQEVSDVVNTTSSGIDSPTISQRILKTSVAVDSGQTLALGGLIQDSSSLTRSQVPLLGDVPVVGQLFKNKEDDVTRSELLILITPRVIRDAAEARRITDEFRQRLQQPDTLLRQGGPVRHQVTRLLK